MALISKKFIDTIQGNNSDITPIVLLGDLNEETKEYDILDLFSTRAVTVHKNHFTYDDVNAIQAKPILKNISSIKNSIDIEKRKLKINTFRFSVYNYYDSVKSLSSSDDYVQTEDANPIASLVGKHIILYYKSKYTREIDISQDTIHFNDNDSCPILFRGVITRAKISEDIITLQGEDFTQDVFKEKSLPSTKISDLEEVIRNNVIVEDKETPIPMVFGKVDKSPSITFNTNYSNNEGFKSLGFLHDIYPTTGTYTTAKLLNDFDSPTYMYVKDGDDYLVFQYETYYYEYLGRTYFLESSTSETAVVPELSSSQSQSIYCLGYTYATNAISDLSAGNTESLDGTISQDEIVNPDYSPLLANYGMKRGWYRQGEIQNFITDEESFDFGHKAYTTSTAKGTGRWILVQLDKKEVLQGFRCYSKLYVDPNDNTAVNDSSNNPENRNTVYIKPFNPDQWKTIMESSLAQGNWVFTLYEDDDLPASYTASGSPETFPRVHEVKQVLSANEPSNTRDNLGFFIDTGGQSYSYDLIGGGLTPEKVKEDYDNSTPCDRIILFESYQGWGTPTKTIKCGGYMHSFSAKYLKKIEDYTSSEFYASIIGRKDYGSTEPIGSLEQQAELTSGTWSDALLGADGVEPDYEAVLDFWDDYFEKKYIIGGSDRYFEEYGGSFEESYDVLVTIPYLSETWLEPYLMGAANYWELFTDVGISKNLIKDDTGTFTYESIDFPDLESLALDDSTLMKSNQVVSLALHGIMKKYHHAAWLHHAVEYVYYGAVEDGIVGYEESQAVAYVIIMQEMAPQTHFGFYRFLRYMRTRGDVYLKYVLDRMQERFEVWSVFRRALIRRTLQYVYQNEVSDEPELDTIFQDTSTNSWYGNLFGQTWGGSQPFAYQWNSPELNLVDENGEIIPEGWLDHFEAYMNDTVETALYSDGNAFFGQVYNHIYYSAVNSQYNELHSWNDDPALVGEGYSEIANQYTNPSIVELYKYISVDSLDIECFSGGVEGGVGYITNGIVNKPIDIIINILSKEIKYGLSENGLPSAYYYNDELISKSREFYSSWEMGFCIDKTTDAEKLISDLCKETQSFFTFKPDGSFDLVTIKEKYTYEDIEHTIQEVDILKYSFNKTKRENIITSCNYFYRYDNGQNKYPKETGTLKAVDLVYGGQYDGDNYYNLSEGVGYKEKNLRFHSETSTARTFQQFDLLNNCNQHILVSLELPLKYVEIEIGNIIYLPLIKNEKVFGVDYSRVSYLNGQAIYPIWIVTEVDIKLDKVVIKAYQLHHLRSNPSHGFVFPEETGLSNIEVNLNERHSFYQKDGQYIRNWNYYTGPFDPDFNYVHNDDLQIPYFDIDQNGIINIADLVALITSILNNEYSAIFDYNQDGICNVIDIIDIVEIIMQSENAPN